MITTNSQHSCHSKGYPKVTSIHNVPLWRQRRRIFSHSDGHKSAECHPAIDFSKHLVPVVAIRLWLWQALENEHVPTSSCPIRLQLAKDLGILLVRTVVHNEEHVVSQQPHVDVHWPAEKAHHLPIEEMAVEPVQCSGHCWLYPAEISNVIASCNWWSPPHTPWSLKLRLCVVPECTLEMGKKYRNSSKNERVVGTPYSKITVVPWSGNQFYFRILPLGSHDSWNWCLFSVTWFTTLFLSQACFRNTVLYCIPLKQDIYMLWRARKLKNSLKFL